MLRGRGWILISLSVLLAAGAALVANRWMSSRAAALEANKPNMVGVVVAAIEIPFGTKVEARHLGTIEMIKGTEPAGVYTDIKAVEGKVARSTILGGELLMEARFVDQGTGSTLAAVVAPNMRAVTVRVDDVVGVGGFLLPGNRVDVVSAREEGKTATAATILNDVKVLAVDQTAQSDQNQPVVVRAVTLEVTPEGAEAIVKAKQEGTIQLTLRNPLDKSITAPKVEAPAPVVAAVPKPAARPAVKAEPTVMVIRGTRVAEKTGS
jgi:pilus assembly protein CpaB